MRQRNRFSKYNTPQELREKLQARLKLGTRRYTKRELEQHKVALALLDLHDEIARKVEQEQEGR